MLSIAGDTRDHGAAVKGQRLSIPFPASAQQRNLRRSYPHETVLAIEAGIVTCLELHQKIDRSNEFKAEHCPESCKIFGLNRTPMSHAKPFVTIGAATRIVRKTAKIAGRALMPRN